jgi:hypothetical protein
MEVAAINRYRWTSSLGAPNRNGAREFDGLAKARHPGIPMVQKCAWPFCFAE